MFLSIAVSLRKIQCFCVVFPSLKRAGTDLVTTEVGHLWYSFLTWLASFDVSTALLFSEILLPAETPLRQSMLGCVFRLAWIVSKVSQQAAKMDWRGMGFPSL